MNVTQFNRIPFHLPSLAGRLGRLAEERRGLIRQRRIKGRGIKIDLLLPWVFVSIWYNVVVIEKMLWRR
jgi:hypothetical protein